MLRLEGPILPTLVLSLFLACAPPEDPATASEPPEGAATQESLADTHWRLVQFQSMDDSIGTLTPEDPTRFTLNLRADGTVSLRLDCNRGNGTWSADAADDGKSGSFTFGPLATTKALCPPPNLDERIARDAEFVRSFLLQDGQLHLSLMADGGIYSWQPDDSIRSEDEPDAAIEEALRAAEPDYRREVVGDGPEARYAYAHVDLNGDGAEEAVVYLLGPFFCGTGGCTLHLFTTSDAGYQPVARFPLSRLPIIVSESTTETWHDLYLPQSGGGAPPSFVRYTGPTYVESERIEGSDRPDGLQVLAGDVSFQNDHPLTPSER